jgi:hypothetical protein
LRDFFQSEEYRSKAQELFRMRREAVTVLSTKIAESVRGYLPSVKEFELAIDELDEVNTIGDLLIDDGNRTRIADKGDGVKSLVTMALIQELARERSKSTSFILAVDEPEAHLHSAVVHDLQGLFQQISASQQVILATHNPIFVNRDSVRSNVLVLNNEAKSARSLDQVRKAIGVKLHDNLESAEIVVLVEGVSDALALPVMLLEVDSRWASQSSGRIAFRSIAGTGKMRAQIQREKLTLSKIVSILDDDQAGRQESLLLINSGVLAPNNVFMLGDTSRKSSEMEDLLDPAAYLESLSLEFDRQFTAKHFQRGDQKWSLNFLDAARAVGLAGDPDTLTERAKTAVSRAIKASPDDVLKTSARERLTALSNVILGPR